MLNGELYTQRLQKLIYHAIHMYSGITSGRVLNGELNGELNVQKGMSTHAICPVEWGEISTKQSVDKCKQINFYCLQSTNIDKLTSVTFVQYRPIC